MTSTPRAEKGEGRGKDLKLRQENEKLQTFPKNYQGRLLITGHTDLRNRTFNIITGQKGRELSVKMIVVRCGTNKRTSRRSGGKDPSHA